MTAESIPLSARFQIGIAFLFIIATWIWHQRSSARLPPGPNPIPIIGNTALPKDTLSSFKSWADQYGDIMTLRILGKNLIILNSRKAADELLERRSSSTYARPVYTMAHKIVGMEHFPSQTSDPDKHRTHRRMFATALSPRASEVYWPTEMLEVRKAVRDMLNGPDNYAAAIQRALASIALKIAYGYDIDNEDDGLIKKIQRMMRILVEVQIPGRFLVDVIPALNYLPTWIPGMKFKRDGEVWAAQIREVEQIPFDRVKQDRAAGIAKPSLVSTLLDQSWAVDEENGIKVVAGAIYNAGADTTTAAIHNFLAAMVMFPDVQEKAQRELDAIIGRGRPPTMEDRAHLPYCSAVVLETLRWRPVIPAGIPHVFVRDEEFMGYLIPKGSVTLANLWAMSRNAAEYPDPEIFKPERFLEADKHGAENVEKNRFVFGFGRRVCPGIQLADSSLFAAVVSILWTCNISRPSSGSAKPQEMRFGTTLRIHRPNPFPIHITSRFLGAAEQIRDTIHD
ncbi:cytochrome P450 [Calocera cornea HHB12733]|uniref:Cytochrome P450 n=1 Tax=Calocera cornea HHB12733 TaxID=1353952 RepID=A0A165GUW4_9BASI|nr:cytochrome P450 [Calocera cornea HHB12733]